MVVWRKSIIIVHYLTKHIIMKRKNVNRSTWTTEEKRVLAACVEKAPNIDEGLRRAASKLSRSFKACQGQFYYKPAAQRSVKSPKKSIPTVLFHNGITTTAKLVKQTSQKSFYLAGSNLIEIIH